MQLKRISKHLIISGTLIIWIIKYILRPLDLFDEPSRFFMGVAPNLLGSFLIPFGAYLFFSGKNFLIARIFRIQSSYDLKMVCLLGFGMLVVNEYLQLMSIFGRTFNYFDILFSFIGLLSAYFVFSKLQQKYMTQAA
ncbi:MAG: hypothetical protein V9F46_05425 [Chitinophagaceae bacterium]